ncbi:MAG: YaiO family outer membrane beta-barrel protein [Limnohabitans sp.]
MAAVWAQDADTARSLLRAGQVEQAAQAYSVLIERSPGDPDHWLGRGLARSRQGQWQAAMDDLEKAAALAPGYADVWSALADVYRWNDRPAAAADAYGRLAVLRPTDAQVRVLQARSLLSAGDVQGARNAMRLARELGASAQDLPVLPDASSGTTVSRQTSVPEAASQGYRWALSAGLFQTRAGSFSARENSVGLRHYTPRGSIAIERLGQQRFGYSDEAWAVDAYPRLWQGAYANLRYQQTSTADLYPPRAWRAELYQNVGGGWELAASRDFLGFGSGVRIDGISVGKYWGNFFARWRHQQVHSDSSSGRGDRFFVRYYYEGDADHYVELNLSQGRSDDFSTGLILPSRSDSRGVVWYHFVRRDWGFKLSASQSNDSAGVGVRAQNAGVSLVRRW